MYQFFSGINKSCRKWLLAGVFIVSFIGFGYYVDLYFIHYQKSAQLDWGGQCKQLTSAIENYAPHYDAVILDKNVPCIPAYFSFYIPTIPVKYAPVTWHKSEAEQNKKYLYIRPYYGNPKPDKLVRNIYLSNKQKDIFVQIFKL